MVKKTKRMLAAEILWNEIDAAGLEIADPLFELAFLDERNWRFDLAWPLILLAIECDGLGMAGRPGGHQNPKGIRNQNEKRNAAIEAGWRVLVYPSDQITQNKKRRHRIAHQVIRVICGASSPGQSAHVLTGD